MEGTYLFKVPKLSLVYEFFLSYHTTIFKPTIFLEPVFQPAKISFIHSRNLFTKIMHKTRFNDDDNHFLHFTDIYLNIHY
jgi:hypothetical protein